MRRLIFSLVSLTLCSMASAQTFVKLNFNEATAAGPFTSGTAYTLGATEFLNMGAVGLGTGSAEFVDSGAPDDANEVAADGAMIDTASSVYGTREGGKALITESGNRDEGLRIFSSAAMTSKSFTMEAIWYSPNFSIPNQGSARQSIIGDNWPQLDLFGPDPRRSHFQMYAVGRDRFDYESDGGLITLSGVGTNAVDVWHHDAMVFEYNDVNPAQCTLRAYRNGSLVKAIPWDASLKNVGSLFGITTQSLNLHYVTAGMTNSFEYRINDHRRGLHGGIDAIAISQGALTPSQFVLPFASAPADALVVVNPSFEFNPPAPHPTYGPVAGWVVTGQAGVNTSAGPFFDNGTCPDGAQVAFLQNASSLTQTVPGFQAGKTYVFTARVNARASTGAPKVQVRFGTTVVIPSTSITAVAGTNQFQTISGLFTATADSGYAVQIQSLESAYDNALLVDSVAIALSTAAGDWSLYE